MTEYLWTIPTRGDGRRSRPSGRNRGDWSPIANRGFGPTVHDVRLDKFDFFDHLSQIARAAEISGFDGVVVPHDSAGEDPWIVAAAIARETTRLRVIPEFEPSFATPVYATKMSATFQRFSRGRLGWKLSVDSDAATRRALGNLLDDDGYAASASEFLHVAKGFWYETPFSFKGRFFEVEAGGLNATLSRHEAPPIYLAGNSPSVLTLAARYADVFITELNSAGELPRSLSNLDELSGALGAWVTNR